MANDLSKWADDNSMFFKLEVGETVVAVLKGYRIIPNKFDPAKETVEYTLEIDGEDKIWTNGSGSIAKAMSKVEAGATVAISKVSTPNGMGKYVLNTGNGVAATPQAVKKQTVVERATTPVQVPNLMPSLDDPFGNAPAAPQAVEEAEEEVEETPEELELKLKLAQAKAKAAKAKK